MAWKRVEKRVALTVGMMVVMVLMMADYLVA
jgi:hypothetical protein